MHQNGLEIRLIKTEEELKAVFQIREKVFIQGQGVPRTIEMDGHDEYAEHVIVLCDGEPIGCARIRYPENKAKLERIAILEEHRGKHYGRKLVEFLISHCARQKAQEIYMNSQYHVKDYYKKFGFREVGPPFIEANIKHIKMVFEESADAPGD